MRHLSTEYVFATVTATYMMQFIPYSHQKWQELCIPYATEMLSWDCLFPSKKEVLCTEVDLINIVTF